VLTFRHLLRFLQCPLQGSASVHLPFSALDVEDDAAAAFREHEDFDLPWPRAVPLLREALARAYALSPTPDDDALAHGLDDATALAALDGTLPHGTFGAASRGLHLGCLQRWRDTLASLGGLDGAPARVYFGHAPEGLRGAEIRPAARLLTEVAVEGTAERLAVELHGETSPLATLGGQPATFLAVSSSTPQNANGRDRLTAFIEHVALATSAAAGAPRRRVVVLRPNQDKPETFTLRPLAQADALAYAASLTNALLGAIHPYLLPCEAVLGWWKKKEPRPELTSYVQTLRDADWKTYFSSEWGPVPDATERYPVPDEAAALRMVDDRFGLYLRTIEDDAAPERGASSKRRAG
jgi:hypothetical protein